MSIYNNHSKTITVHTRYGKNRSGSKDPYWVSTRVVVDDIESYISGQPIAEIPTETSLDVFTSADEKATLVESQLLDIIQIQKKRIARLETMLKTEKEKSVLEKSKNNIIPNNIKLASHLATVDPNMFESVILFYDGEEEEEIIKQEFITNYVKKNEVTHIEFMGDNEASSMIDEGVFIIEDFKISNKVLNLYLNWEK